MWWCDMATSELPEYFIKCTKCGKFTSKYAMTYIINDSVDPQYESLLMEKFPEKVFDEILCPFCNTHVPFKS